MASFYDELEEIAGYGEEPPYEEDKRDTEVRGPEAHAFDVLILLLVFAGMLPSLFGVPAIVVSPLGLPFASLVSDVPVRPVPEPMKEKNPLAADFLRRVFMPDSKPPTLPLPRRQPLPPSLLAFAS
ncbi:hypothetical protein VNO80_35208 [Phaseolus coccineus]|uniref:Uncharacterized protein n=1 Tax=Phaseolus coccineus TaxID=3886 RepID=A0AAN9Q5F2_PHACN